MKASVQSPKSFGSAASSSPAQRKGGLKTIVDNRPSAIAQRKLQGAAQYKLNRTGLPDGLKAGIENLSGYSLDGVRVHYNSSKPAEVSAHAYAQGTDIYLAPGQQRHLAHEAWHVVQQMQGRVRPTKQINSVLVNDNAGLEREADLMGAKALSLPQLETGFVLQNKRLNNTYAPVQGYWDILSELVSIYGVGAFVGTAIVAGVAALYMNSGQNNQQENKAPGKKAPGRKAPGKKAPGKKAPQNRNSNAVVKQNTQTVVLHQNNTLQGTPGDCLYTAVSLAQGNGPRTGEQAFRQIATNWLLQAADDHEVFNYGDRAAIINVVSTPQAWSGDAGDVSAAVLALSLGITLNVVTANNTYVFNPGNANTVNVYYDANHYTSIPVNGIHNNTGKSITGKPGIKLVSAQSKPCEPALSYQEKEIKLSEFRTLRKTLANQAAWSSEDKEIMLILGKILAAEDFSNQDQRAVDRYINKLSSKAHLKSSSASSPILSEADIFASKYPDAVRIGPLDSIVTALRGTQFADNQNFVSSTFRRQSPTLPRFDTHTMYHDTQGGGGGGVTIFGVIVGTDRFLVARGHHTADYYTIDWVCANNVVGWDTRRVAFN